MSKISMRNKLLGVVGLLVMILTGLTMSEQSLAQENIIEAATTKTVSLLSLDQAVVCEGIKDYEPVNEAIVFSLEIGKIYCFTSFDQVLRKSIIYHNWYRNDRLVTTKRLSLQPPKWSTFSSIQLRAADKGPWRVEIKDQSKEIVRVVRFSVTD